MKFGGSSVDTAESIGRVVEIVRRHLDRRPLVVVSAMGKTTNKLLQSAEAAAAGDTGTALAGFEELRETHRRQAHGIVSEALRPRLDAALDGWFAELHTLLGELAATRALTPRAADAAAGFGELLASRILSLALESHGVGSAWVDCRQVLVTDAAFTRAKPLYGPTDARLRQAVEPAVGRGTVPVVGGYVGATPEGVTTTLGKEGSDFSAAIFGAALGAEEVQIWTDVDGIMTADPRVVPGARRVPSLSFAEALELACSGAKKPHPGTLEPASRANVPIRILNSTRAEGPGEGTLIGRRETGRPGRPVIQSITCRANTCSLLLLPLGPWAGDGFLPRVLEAARRFRPSLMTLSTEAKSADLALDQGDSLTEIQSELQRLARVDVGPGSGVVSVVSEDLATHPELVERVLDAARSWKPRLVRDGAACATVRCLVDEADLHEVVATLHDRLADHLP
ncbi:MAG TPA: aspartate kinase [Thermoanaerobaculia bacterium]|nr:aspartate kinase [Thermoanaerobaculia bacterium]